MDDRTLLEMAAKAAEIDGKWGEIFDVGDDQVDCTDMFFIADGGDVWNPLTDDGDALRLAIRLHLGMELYGVGASVKGWHERVGPLDDAYAATRRAIVRAAAEIGKSRVSAPGAVEGGNSQ